MPLSPDTVWFISGCSTGLGRALAERVLASGQRAVVTARDVARVADLAGDTALALALDVTDAGQIAAAVAAAKARFGRIDVLVNNAGYGYQASIEEGDEAEIRAQFDANVFGLFALTRAVLPVMRGQGNGYVINITSVAGLIGFPGSGYYAASKHAVEGFTDALVAEGAPIGIRATCVEPGPFRTDWAGRSLRQTPVRIDAYADTAGKRLASTSDVSGHQTGDPARAADAMIALAGEANPPRHMVLGAWGVEQVRDRMQARISEMAARADAGIATDFPG